MDRIISRINPCLEKFKNQASLKIQLHLAYYDEYIENNIKSEIEKILFASLICDSYEMQVFGNKSTGKSRVIALRKGESTEKLIIPKINNHIRRVDYIIPQYKIFQYRVDFLLIRLLYQYDYERLVACSPVVIECDGHNFHEKTKEQASKDKAREREIQGASFLVLRFSGSEIWNRPDCCALEINRFFEDNLELNFSGTDKISSDKDAYRLLKPLYPKE